MIFTSIDDAGFEDVAITLPTGWTYFEAGMEPSMAEELFDGTCYFNSLHEARVVEVFVREGLLLW